MLLIIEGCDLTGKTTLAQRLIGDVAVDRIAHAGPPTAHPLEAYESSIASYDPLEPGLLVLDRFHMGEHVWPTIFKRETQLDLAVARHIELFLHSRGAHVVYAERDPLRLAADVNNAFPPEPINGSQVPQILELFAEAIAFGGRPVSGWDYERDGESEIESILGYTYAAAAEVVRPWTVTPEWIGNPVPKTLLVGDEFGLARSLDETRSPEVPFSPWRNASGHYLLSALPAESWRTVAITNAHRGRTGKRANVGIFWESILNPQVIALGVIADGVLSDQGVPHATIPHPQWWRRFHYHERDSYTQLIREASGC